MICICMSELRNRYFANSSFVSVRPGVKQEERKVQCMVLVRRDSWQLLGPADPKQRSGAVLSAAAHEPGSGAAAHGR